VGYRISTPCATVALATDLGTWDATLVEELRPADLLIVEANHSRSRLMKSSYPWAVCQRIIGPRGHLDNYQAGQLLAAIGADGRPRDVRLAHLSQQANQPRLALQQVRRVLADAQVATLRTAVLPREALPKRKGMPIWSSDAMFRQMTMFE
jgi:hypothetical protein